MRYRKLPDVVRHARELFEDLTFSYAARWKSKDSSRRVIGHLPIYIPREILHAANMLPVGLFGGGDRIPVVKGDAYFQSYICRLPRSVIELAEGGRLDAFDGFLFPSICDVIRNLSGVFQLMCKDKYVRYLDFPQNFDPRVGGVYYARELRRLLAELLALNGCQVTCRRLNRAIRLYNRNRRLVAGLANMRAEQPHRLPAVDWYLILRAGFTLCVEDHNALLQRARQCLDSVAAEPEDRIRVVVSGAFCEQPPLGLIKAIENAGCYIVDDDFQLGLRWIRGPLPENSADPLGALVEAYLGGSVLSSAVYDGDSPKEERLVERVRQRKAEGVLFCSPSFCDPALLDQPRLEAALDRLRIRHFHFQYHENLGQFHVIKEQAGTFSDLIKLGD